MALGERPNLGANKGPVGGWLVKFNDSWKDAPMWRKGFVQLLLCRAVTLALLPLDKTLRELLCSKVIGKAVGEFKLISRFYFCT